VDSLLRLPDVSRAVGLRKTAIYQRIRSGDFPPPVQLTERAVAWRTQDIEAWIRARPSTRTLG
jgi:prophage regulatory protein